MCRYRQNMLTAPWWQHSLVFAVALGTVSTLSVWFQASTESWSEAVLPGVLAGLIAGAVLGPWMARTQRRAREAAGDLSPEQFTRSYTAARRGPIPTDPTILQAAYQLARQQLRTQRGSTAMVTLGCAGFIASYVFLAIDRSPWYWLGAALVAAVLVNFLRQRARLRHRAERLRPDNH